MRPSHLIRGLRVAALAGVLATALAVMPQSAHAASGVAEYRTRVERALEAVRAAESDPPDAEAATGLAVRIEALLPEGEAVSAAGADVTVTDPGTARLLSELEGAATADGREQALAALGRHLTSLKAAVGTAARAAPSDPEALRRLLAATSTAPAVGGSDIVREWLDRAARALAEWLSGVSSTPGGAVATRTVGIAVLLVLALVASWAAWTGVRSWRRSVSRRERTPVGVDAAPVVAAAEGLPEDAAAYAEALAAEGRFRDAVRALFGGAARALSERGLVGRTRTRTNAELLAEVGPAAPEVARPLRSLTEGFEVAWYGHRDPGDAGLDAARRAYRDVLDAAAGRPARGAGSGEREEA